ncbi:recombinase family protein [Streptomyces sp. NPDC058632]|uniref:recombinase family protein n=1 Tax=unclassified Streptomyces TaxID=2593676 RepID=UPI00365A7D63
MKTPSDGDTADLLASVPAVRGALVGYARVSPQGQLLERQIHVLTEAGCNRIFADKKSGTWRSRSISVRISGWV